MKGKTFLVSLIAVMAILATFSVIAYGDLDVGTPNVEVFIALPSTCGGG